MSLRHKITIAGVSCGQCGCARERTEAARWRCVNVHCPLVLREYWPRFRMEQVVGVETNIPGVKHGES